MEEHASVILTGLAGGAAAGGRKMKVLEVHGTANLVESMSSRFNERICLKN